MPAVAFIRQHFPLATFRKEVWTEHVKILLGVKYEQRALLHVLLYVRVLALSFYREGGDTYNPNIERAHCPAGEELQLRCRP